MNLDLEESERQLVLLALAELALSRPGFDFTLAEIARKCRGSKMYEEFKRLNAERVKATRLPMDPAPDTSPKTPA